MRRHRIYISLSFSLIFTVLIAFAVSTAEAQESEQTPDLSGRWMVGDGGFLFDIQMTTPLLGSIIVDPEDEDPFVDGKGKVVGRRVTMIVHTFLLSVEPIPIWISMWGRADTTGQTITGQAIIFLAMIPIGYGTWDASRVE